MEPQDQSYQQSLAQSRVGGGGGASVRSRSSSVVSTRTGVTITTLQDDTRSVRSMELVVGGRIFHISRDGSRITEHPGLPPYTAAPPEYSFPDTNILSAMQMHELPAPNIPDYDHIAWPENEHDYHQHPVTRQRIPSVSLTEDRTEERSETPRLQDSEHLVAELPGTPVERERRGSGSGSGLVSRAHSFVPGPEKITVVAKRRSVSESNIQANLYPNAHHYNGNSSPNNNNNNNNNNTHYNNNVHRHNFLRRRNGIRLPQLDTGMSFESLRNAIFSAGPSSSPRMTHSAGPSIGGSSADFQNGITHSRGSYSSRNTPTGEQSSVSRGRSPPTSPQAIPTATATAAAIATATATAAATATATRNPLLAIPQGPAMVEEGYADTDEPPAMDTENEVSIHFSRMIRSIDREHRRVLHQKCRELADMRERLNEVDQVYRKELKNREFVIDELRQALTRMESQMDEKIERARNEVEDVWERRWKDQEKLLLDMQRRVSQAELSRIVGRRRGAPARETKLTPVSPVSALEDDEEVERWYN
ncbi:hypothetical protein MGYG_06810 [Nannizzia gypsea CBS 118893]|uniref:Uncharacterized protein n=1 Tax=Arthroderma gypseum (strain ATCC MYA-4604 / CBS 118893) TaxID=535722 RepID=E4V195_ARTGP|nr:hypothetical protein MGYG_06810 [Nannizzia gypsea CBS 118893]EFR03810.1 hypothetical protein MGYG_06810 [Nannizzia gypsea CBS 118893]